MALIGAAPLPAATVSRAAKSCVYGLLSKLVLPPGLRLTGTKLRRRRSVPLPRGGGFSRSGRIVLLAVETEWRNVLITIVRADRSPTLCLCASVTSAIERPMTTKAKIKSMINATARMATPASLMSAVFVLVTG